MKLAKFPLGLVATVAMASLAGPGVSEEAAAQQDERADRNCFALGSGRHQFPFNVIVFRT